MVKLVVLLLLLIENNFFGSTIKFVINDVTIGCASEDVGLVIIDTFPSYHTLYRMSPSKLEFGIQFTM